MQTETTTRRVRLAVVGARHWIKSIPTAALPREIEHARETWSIYRHRDEYYGWFAITLGVYRAELRRRLAAEAR